MAWKESRTWRFSGESVWLHIEQNKPAKSLFLTDERLAEGLGYSTLLRSFASRSSFCLLYFEQKFLGKQALFVFSDSCKVMCTRFPFSSTMSVTASHSRSKITQISELSDVACNSFQCLICTGYIRLLFFLVNETVIPVNIHCASLPITLHNHGSSTYIKTF